MDHVGASKDADGRRIAKCAREHLVVDQKTHPDSSTVKDNHVMCLRLREQYQTKRR